MIAALALGTLFAAAPATSQENPHDFLPAEFVGTWASSRADCDDIAWVTIERDRVSAYEMDSRVLIASSRIHESAPNGQEALTVKILTAATAEGEVYFGKLRISKAGDLLFMSNAELVSEADHWKYPNIRCP